MVPHPLIPQNIAGKFVPPDPGATQPILLVDCGRGSAFSRCWGRGQPIHLTQCSSCGNRARAALDGIEVEGLAGLGKGTSTGATATLSAPW